MIVKIIEFVNRLVGGLVLENVRWVDFIKDFRKQELIFFGDVLFIIVFVLYVGCFMKQYRLDLMDKYWVLYLKGLKIFILVFEGLDLLILFIDDV